MAYMEGLGIILLTVFNDLTVNLRNQITLFADDTFFVIVDSDTVGTAIYH